MPRRDGLGAGRPSNRAPPATAEGRWSRRPRERPGQSPRPARGSPGRPAVPGRTPGGAGPARAGPAVPRPAPRPPPATTEACEALRASGRERCAARPSQKAGAAGPARPWPPVPSVAGKGRQPGPAPLPDPGATPAPLPAGPHREPPPPRVSRIEAARMTRMFPLPLLCLHSGVSLPLVSVRSAKVLFCPSARSVSEPIVTLYAYSRHRTQRCPQQCLSMKDRKKKKNKKTHAALSQSRSLPRASRSHQLQQKAEFLPLALWEPPAT